MTTAPPRSASKLSIRDVLTVAAMLALALTTNSIIGALALLNDIAYNYIAAGVEMFVAATFYLVAAHRVNKHGLLLIWVTAQGLLFGIFGYPFLIPFFLLVAVICELTMIGRNTYRNPVRNAIGWGTLGAAMPLGNLMPLWVNWESYRRTAEQGGFSDATLQRQFELAEHPGLMLIACVISVVGAVAGVWFGERVLRRHFRKAGMLE